MRVAILAVSLVVLALGAWVAHAATPLPPECSAADIQAHAILRSAGWGTNTDPGYARYCGPGHAVVQVDNRSFTFKVGRCTSTRAYFGVLGNGVGGASPGRGVVLILERAKHRGRNHLMDWAAALPGVSLDRIPGTGTAVVSKDLKSATFSLDIEGSTNKVRGRWSCA